MFPPDYELECYRALAAALPGDQLPIRSERRLDDRTGDPIRAGDRGPQQRLSRGSRLRAHRHAPRPREAAHPAGDEHRGRELRAARGQRAAIAPSTSSCSTRRSGAASAPCVKAAGICETFQLGVAVHSSGELGIQLATMLHLGAVVPNLAFAADAHYHHLARRRHRGGQAGVRARVDPRAGRSGTWRSPRPREARSVRGAATASSGSTPTIRIPVVPGGHPSCQTIGGPIPADEQEPFTRA